MISGEKAMTPQLLPLGSNKVLLRNKSDLFQISILVPNSYDGITAGCIALSTFVIWTWAAAKIKELIS